MTVKCIQLGLLLSAISVSSSLHLQAQEAASENQTNTRPNVILLMSDDQGWGDVGYNGNKIIKTPHLDKMAAQGLRLDRFYAASPVCSPTRASVLTGRHPFRYGIEWAGVGHLPSNEVTLAEVLKENGYHTGHFGKWHVGELSKTVNQSYFKGDLANPEHYAPPWDNGYDESFATESMMPTYNPYYYQGGDYGTEGYRHLQTEPTEKGQKTGGFRWRDYYWTGSGQLVDEWLEGDDSEIVMDRALDFIEQNVKKQNSFFTTIWFHTPHTPIVAGNEDRALYSEHPIQAQHFYGSLTAMDRQIGRLRQELKRLGVSDNTIVWFKSDNGPSYIHNFNSSGQFSGKKAELKEGGIRVPAVIEWPAKYTKPAIIQAPMSTMDVYPTILAAAKIKQPVNQPILDGENILPLLSKQQANRNKAIPFQSPVRGVKYDADNTQLQFALSGTQFKLFSGDNGKTWQLFNLLEDPSETTDLSKKFPEVVAKMKLQLLSWRSETQIDAQDTYDKK
jgi:arylsulfatase A-like enzyme